MALTPQLIKDQEFQIKFRGCDPLEVRDYLEVLAEAFFEMQEQNKEQWLELERLRQLKENSDDVNSSLETDIASSLKISEDLKDGCAQKEVLIEDQREEIKELLLRIGDLEQEAVEHEEELSEGLAKVVEAEEALRAVEGEKRGLGSKIEILHEQMDELRKEEVDFKATLSAAQRFAEDLREKSRVEAGNRIEEADAEIRKIKDDAHDELQRLPLEISALKKKKSEVKADLQATLLNYLETIDVFYPDPEEGVQDKRDDKVGGELFQSITIQADGSLASVDTEGLTKEEAALAESARDTVMNGHSVHKNGESAVDRKDIFAVAAQEGEKEISS